VARGLVYSRKGVASPGGRIGWLGRNFRASTLGVFSVWMKIVRAPPAAAEGRRRVDGWCRGCKVGLLREFAAAIAGSRIPWCRQRAELGWRDGSEGFAGLALVNSGTAVRGARLNAIVLTICPGDGGCGP
jgi:hypothetical protein